MAEQLPLDLGLITVHCFTCPHRVAAASPQEAHDLMEQHYDEEHAVLIRRLADS